MKKSPLIPQGYIKIKNEQHLIELYNKLEEWFSESLQESLEDFKNHNCNYIIRQHPNREHSLIVSNIESYELLGEDLLNQMTEIKL